MLDAIPRNAICGSCDMRIEAFSESHKWLHLTPVDGSSVNFLLLRSQSTLCATLILIEQIHSVYTTSPDYFHTRTVGGEIIGEMLPLSNQICGAVGRSKRSCLLRALKAWLRILPATPVSDWNQACHP